MKDNKGFSLVELIIAIAVMSVILGMLIGNLGYINNSAAKGCANSIKTAIGQTRIKTMGKQETYLYIYRDGKGYSMNLINTDSKTGTSLAEDKDELAASKVSVSYVVNKVTGGAGSEISLDSDGDYMLIGFDRETGKVNTYTDSSNTSVFQFTQDGSSVTKNVNVASDINTIVIKVQSGNNIYEITLYGATGKVKMEKK